MRRVSSAGTFRLHAGQHFLSQALNNEYIGLEGEQGIRPRARRLRDHSISRRPAGGQCGNRLAGRPLVRARSALKQFTVWRSSASDGAGTWGSRSVLGDVWLRSADGGENLQLTADHVDGYGWTLGLPAIRAKWSPDSRKLALRKMDFCGTPTISLCPQKTFVGNIYLDLYLPSILLSLSDGNRFIWLSERGQVALATSRHAMDWLAR